MEETEVSINPYSCNASVFVSPQQRFGGRNERQALLGHMHAARRHHRPVDPPLNAREPDTRLDCAINDSQIVEDLQRARRNAERVAEKSSCWHSVAHAHGRCESAPAL